MDAKEMNVPRIIKPELVEIGDVIVVTLPESRGITQTKRGRVSKRVDSGDVRTYTTDEGAILFTWQPERPRLVKIILVDRQPFQQVELFSMIELDRLNSN